MYYDHASPAIISNCFLVSNVCGYSIVRMTRQTEVVDCMISDNTLNNPGTATMPIAALSAIQINPAKTHRIRNCRILNNKATAATPYYGYYGPGVFAASNTLLENCLVAGNNRGGVYVDTNAVGVSLSSCTIAGNTNYGVFLNTRQSQVLNCILRRPPLPRNLFFSGFFGGDLPAAN